LTKIDPGHPLVADEPVDRRAERVGDLCQRGGGGNRQSELALDVAQQPTGMLQLRHVDVAVHPVDALDLEHHMISEDIGNGAR
jgi:hypothetical protein